MISALLHGNLDKYLHTCEHKLSDASWDMKWFSYHKHGETAVFYKYQAQWWCKTRDVGGRGLMEQCLDLLHVKVRCSLSVFFIIWCLPLRTSGKRNIRAFWTEKISIYTALEVKVNCVISAPPVTPCRIFGYCLSRCCFVWPCCDSQITKRIMFGAANCTDILSFEGIQTCLMFLPLWNTKESVKYH